MTLDEGILREAKAARDRVLTLQHEVERAQTELRHAIRRLNAAGGSMREIAEQLGMSHQRVHQIVDEAAGPLEVPRRRLFGRGGGFRRFTERARDVVVFAQEEAYDLGHNYLGTEHVLLGLLRSQEGLAAQVLSGLGVDRDSVRAEVVRRIGEGKGGRARKLPFTPRSKKVLELALRESLSLGHDYIGTEHILLALGSEGEGVAAEVLRDLGAAPERVREEIMRRLAA